MQQPTISEEIQRRIDAFKEALTTSVESALDGHLLSHDCSIIGTPTEKSIRESVALEFTTASADVYIVGSAKLGFSPKPGQAFRHFSDRSDIDVAVVSPTLYTEIWHEVQQMEQAGEFFDKAKFSHYHLRGWIRPDALPSKTEYVRCSRWWEFFRALSSREEYLRTKISGGLYYDNRFLRQYQAGALTVLRQSLLET